MDDKSALLAKAIEIAARAHAGQVDKGGQPYILHPLRVMLRCETLEQRIAAVLHDVVEDCGLALDGEWAKPFPEPVLHAIDCLTRRRTADGAAEPYLESFIERVKTSRIALRVKLADIDDNLDPSRVMNDSAAQARLRTKYELARASLLAVTD